MRFGSVRAPKCIHREGLGKCRAGTSQGLIRKERSCACTTYILYARALPVCLRHPLNPSPALSPVLPWLHWSLAHYSLHRKVASISWSLWCYLIICSWKSYASFLFSSSRVTLPNRSSRDDFFFLAKSKGCFFVADHAIKIWRLFPFAEEALAPLMTLYCHETPRRLTVAHHKLCAAFHEPATASYNIVVFKTTQKSKCFIQIRIIIFLGTSIAVKRLNHFSTYSAAI